MEELELFILRIPDFDQKTAADVELQEERKYGHRA